MTYAPTPDVLRFQRRIERYDPTIEDSIGAFEGDEFCALATSGPEQLRPIRRGILKLGQQQAPPPSLAVEGAKVMGCYSVVSVSKYRKALRHKA